MTRRSTPQKKLDDPAWSVRVRVLVPENGFSSLPMEAGSLHDWLRKELGNAEHALHPSASGLGDAVAIYFCCVEDARSFLATFPSLVLADDTMSSMYQLPHVPFGRREETVVCNLYNMTTSQEAMRNLFAGIDDRLGNLPPLPEIYPDYRAPIVRKGASGPEMIMARWGMPTPPQFLIGKKTDRGVANVRNVWSPHWRAWLGTEHRCLVPFTAFSERGRDGDIWLAFSEDRPLGFFAGLWTEWRSVRKVRDGETTDELYGFFTTSPNAVVAAVHPKAMPSILTTAAERETWMRAPWSEAAILQRRLGDGALVVIEAPAAADASDD